MSSAVIGAGVARSSVSRQETMMAVTRQMNPPKMAREVNGSANVTASGMNPKRLARPVGMRKYGNSERERSTVRKPEPN